MKYQKLQIKKIKKDNEEELKKFLLHHDNIYHTNLLNIYMLCFKRKLTLEKIAGIFFVSVPSLRRNIMEINSIVEYFNEI